MFPRRDWVGCAVTTLIALVCSTAAGANAQSARLDPAEIADFADALFGAALDEDRFPGAVFAVVENGIIVFARGFGMADVEARRAVDAAATLFPVGSITKPFTATAVMQQVEVGRLDLDADVSGYVDVPVPRGVTLAHLLTHTAGFEDRYIGAAALDAARVPPLRDYLRAHAPAQIRSPGDVVMYSNFGYALAAYVVERATAEPFDAYVTASILAPLDMLRARLDPGRALQEGAFLSKAYAAGVELPEFHLAVWPAGSLQATANEIAHFMIAHLERGRFGEHRILEAATVAEMQRRQFTHRDQLAGWTFGFPEYTVGPQRAILHDGDLPGFNSRMFLLPEHGIGFFVVNNGSDLQLRVDVTDAFLDRFFPAEKPVPPVAGNAASHEQAAELRFDGHYRSARYPRTTADKLAGVALEFRVDQAADGSLVLSPPPIPGLASAETRWLPAGPLLFRSADRDEYIAFRLSADGRPVLLFAPLFGTPWAYEAISWIETQRVQIGFLVAAVLVFFSAALGWPAAAFARRVRSRPAAAPPKPREMRKGARYARWTAAIGSGLLLAFIAGLALALDALIAGDRRLVLLVVFALPIVGLVPVVLSVGFAGVAWRRRYWGIAARAHFTVVALALATFVPFLAYWNLLGFRF